MGKDNGKLENNQTEKKRDIIVSIISITLLVVFIWVSYRTGVIKHTLLQPPIIWLNIL